MASKPISLKAKNAPVVFLFSAWSLALLLVCSYGLATFWQDLQKTFGAVNGKDGILLALSPIISLVATGLLPPEIKAMLLFWRSEYVLPGHRAFSVHAANDPRIDLEQLRASLDAWPVTPKEENALWYRLYKPIEYEPSVAEAHRKFLLARDLTTAGWAFLLLGVPVACFLGSTLWSGVSFFLLIMLHITVFTYVGRIEAVRFVKNVLAHVCATTEARPGKIIVG